jgi:hypothetical protein
MKNKFHRAISLALVGSLMASSAALAADDLAKRVDFLERKIDALITLMQQQQDARSGNTAPAQAAAPVAPAASSATNAPASPQGSLRMGQLYLDVYTFPEIKRGDLPLATDHIAAGSTFADPKGFSFGDFVNLDGTKFLSNYEGTILLSWNGLVFVDSSGFNTFMLVAGKTNTGRIGNDCQASVSIESKEAVNIPINLNTYEPKKWTAQGKLNLAQGFYNFDLRLVCRGNGPNTRQYLNLKMLLAGPGDRSPHEIPAERFGIME